jgi:hypothetical protein
VGDGPVKHRGAPVAQRLDRISPTNRWVV